MSPSDAALDNTKELAELKEIIRKHNEQMVKECMEWSCRERDDGERCPNCPMDHCILL